ncbi:MAG: adenylate/guanylate cyclase domain-containing protein [Arenibacterium sp.]
MHNTTQRKLASILAADLAGFSRMMAEDEIGTIAAVRRLRTDILAPSVARHGGRIVKTMGDGFLIEFGSVVASIEAAIDLQKQLKMLNDAQAEANPLLLRIGIHIGDIVLEDSDIFGDGVNIAARIEPLVQPGGIGISDEAFRQVDGKLAVEWVDGGAHKVKNIPRPIQIWHWGGGALPKAPASEPVLKLPDVPSVAVLPFSTLAGDSEQEYFADGLTEDLITDLSKISGIFVVARNSTQVFKKQNVDIPTIGRQLGVANVIEGSVRKMGERVRINVQLIDAKTGGHLWADRYDGAMAEVFELQDQVCNKVVSELSVTLTKSEAEQVQAVHTQDIAAYELFVQAKAMPFPPVPARMKAASELFQQVVEKAPDFAGGYCGLAWMIGFKALWSHDDPVALGMRAEALAYKAISVDKSFSFSYTVLGLALLAQRRFDECLENVDKAILLSPNDADSHVFAAVMHSMCGNNERAIAHAEKSFRLSPNFVNGPYLNVICHTNFMAGNFEDAVTAFETNRSRGGPLGPPAFCWAAASYRNTGRQDAARQVVDQLTSGFPGFHLEDWNFLALIQDDERREQVRSQFLEAGIPG